MRSRGLWVPAATVLLTAANALAQMPQIGTVSPATATINAGVSQTFTFTGTYSPSAQAGLDVQITYSGIGGGCWFNAAWNAGNPYFMLHDGLTGNDMGTAYFLQGGTASDSLCQVKAQSFTFDGQGNLTMQVGVTFSAAAAGQSFVFLELAVDFATGDNSGWWAQPGDYLNVAAATQGPPQDGTVTPANGSTPPNQNFSLQFTATDPNGWGYSNQVQVLISRTNNPYDYYNSCLVMAAPAQGVAYLGKNDLSSWDIVWFGQGQVSNSQCTLIGQGSQVSINGSSLTMTLNLQFSPTYVGTNYIQEYVWDSQFGTAPFATIGTVTVVGAPPIILTTCNNFPLGVTGEWYTMALEVQGSSSPYRWFLQSGALPSGLGLSTAGILSGTPTQSGNYGFAIGVTDASGLSASTPLTCGLNIFDPSSLVTQSGPPSPDPYMPATQVGVFRSNVAFLEDSNGDGLYEAGADRYIPNFTGPGGFMAGDIPVTGDWDRSGVAKVGIYRSSTGVWYLDANNSGKLDDGDYTYQFGGLTAEGNVDTPVVGDWTGIGRDCIGISRNNGTGIFWLLDLNCNGTFDNTPADAFFPFGGLAGDVPVVGKWIGGATRVGIVRKYAPGGIPQGNPFYWVLDAGAANAGNAPANHPPDCGGGGSINRCFAFGGLDGDVYVTGDWYNSGVSGAGVYRSGYWVLDAAFPGDSQNLHSAGLAFGYGGNPGDVPVTGKWNNSLAPTPSLQSHTSLQINLAGIPIDKYDSVNLDPNYNVPHVRNCATNRTVRDCYYNTASRPSILGGLSAQGVQGVRFGFNYCGGYWSTALNNCGIYGGATLNQAWVNHLSEFFQDVYNAGLRQITPTPALGYAYDGYASYCTSGAAGPACLPDSCGGLSWIHPRSPTYPGGSLEIGLTDSVQCVDNVQEMCTGHSIPVLYWPSIPYGIRIGTTDSTTGPTGEWKAGYNYSYSCSMKNPFFVGWTAIGSVWNAVLSAAKSKGLTVHEFDLGNEMDFANKTVLMRHLTDNVHCDTGYCTQTVGGAGIVRVVDDIARHFMTINNFDATKVTASQLGTISNGGVDCASAYSDSARVFQFSELISAFSGGPVGIPSNPTGDPNTGPYYLYCGGSTTGMTTMPTAYSLPTILDFHPHDFTLQDATITFNALSNLITSYRPSGRNNPNIFSAEVMLGETHSNTVVPTNMTCEGWAHANALPGFEINGFNASTLANGNPVVFRPWWDTAPCYPLQPMVNPPYKPTQ